MHDASRPGAASSPAADGARASCGARPCAAPWASCPSTEDAAWSKCSPPEAVVLHQMLMEMLDREALVALAIEPLHFLRPVRRDPLARRLAEPAVDKSGL